MKTAITDLNVLNKHSICFPVWKYWIVMLHFLYFGSKFTKNLREDQLNCMETKQNCPSGLIATFSSALTALNDLLQEIECAPFMEITSCH